MNEELESARSALVQKIGENITVRRVAKVDASVIGSYVHSNEKIGVLIGQLAVLRRSRKILLACSGS